MEFREVKPEKKKASVVSGFPAHFPEKMWWESVGFKGEEIGFGFIRELYQRIDSNSLYSVNSKH